MKCNCRKCESDQEVQKIGEKNFAFNYYYELFKCEKCGHVFSVFKKRSFLKSILSGWKFKTWKKNPVTGEKGRWWGFTKKF